MFSNFFEGKFFGFVTKFVDAIILTFFFALCSIPFFTIGASFTAYYYTLHKVVFQGRGYTKEFFTFFKDNFKQATLSWLIFVVLGLILGGDIYFTWQLLEAGDKMGNLVFVFVVFACLVIVWALYTLTFIARFENTFKQTLKLAASLAIIHLPSSVAILFVAVFFGVFSYVVPAMSFFVPLMFTVIVHPVFEKIYRGYMTEEDLKAEKERLGIEDED